MHSLKDWNSALSLAGATLDRGIGLMTEYTQQFGKFGITGKLAGW